MRFLEYNLSESYPPYPMEASGSVWVNPNDVSSILQLKNGCSVINMKGGECYHIDVNARTIKADVENASTR